MTLCERIERCLDQAVRNHEAAGISVLVQKNGQDVLYAQAGMAHAASSTPISRDSIFRLYSQSKPVTAAAVMLLMERGGIDLNDPVEKFLPGFANQKVYTDHGLVPVLRPATLMDLLGMQAGLAYPDGDAVGQYTARLFEEAHRQILAGGGISTVELANRIGEIPLSFQPGSGYRYSTCADVLGAVVEVADGRSFAQFLAEEFFQPLGMKDTGFWVPAEKLDRLVTCYKRIPGGLEEFHNLHLAVGDYTREPAFASGGAGLVSTLDDYAAFAAMLMNMGEYQGQRILSPATVRFMTQHQVLQSPWDHLAGYHYGKLMRICVDPGLVHGLAGMGEYGWDGWLGSYFANLPEEGLTILSMQNTVDTGTSTVVRKVRNLILGAHSLGEV